MVARKNPVKSAESLDLETKRSLASLPRLEISGSDSVRSATSRVASVHRSALESVRGSARGAMMIRCSKRYP